MRHFRLPLLFPAVLLLVACSFDYGDLMDDTVHRPDLVMENLEYVRVRGGEHLVRFRADRAERWEDRRTMELWDFYFEQLEQGEEGVEANADGRAGAASVHLDTGNVSLRDGVIINMESEDITITTSQLEWRDTERLLFSAPNDEVGIERADGTTLTGTGITVNIRDRTWAFAGEVSGTYVETEDEEETVAEEETAFDEETAVEIAGQNEDYNPAGEDT